MNNLDQIKPEVEPRKLRCEYVVIPTQYSYVLRPDINETLQRNFIDTGKLPKRLSKKQRMEIRSELTKIKVVTFEPIISENEILTSREYRKRRTDFTEFLSQEIHKAITDEIGNE